MIKLTALLACAVLLAVTSGAQEEEEAAPAAEEAQAPAMEPAAPARPAGPAFRPGARKASTNPVSSGGGGGSGGGPGIMRDASEVQNVGGAGMGQGDADDAPGAGSSRGTSAGGGGAGGGDFTVVDLGDLPTIGQLVQGGGGPGRPVAHVIGGKKWAIRIRHKGPGQGVFPWLLGGTNGDLTGNGKYSYRAAFSKSKGVVSGSGALCPGEMINAAYVTCKQPCSMKWELRFGTPLKDRKWKDLCELENDTIYYLNIEPSAQGCTGSPALGHGCPLVMEIANGGEKLLDP